ncbi:MAG: hypothetical protein DRP22_04380 [Verrucomicrobia bacterium]|nr:MAG: hypothetical protein DRP22_04380 [Verrucomicrobiota bacterium]
MEGLFSCSGQLVGEEIEVAGHGPEEGMARETRPGSGDQRGPESAARNTDAERKATRRPGQGVWKALQWTALMAIVGAVGFNLWSHRLHIRSIHEVQDPRQVSFANRAMLPLEWTNILGMTFRLLPPGSCRAERGLLVVPIPMYMGTVEVPQWCYEMVMGTNPSYFAENPRGPVDSVLWEEAVCFCDRLNELEGWVHYNRAEEGSIRYGYRLPTEVEWEYACRAGGVVHIPDPGRARSRFLLRCAWYLNNADGAPHRVAEREPNPWGLYDMLGNVWEWTSDVFVLGPATSGRMILEPGVVYRVLKGGCWYSAEAECQPASRRRWADDLRWNCVGFRCVLVVPPGWFTRNTRGLP